MKIGLLNVISCDDGFMNKDVSGGYGTVSDFGSGFIARLLKKFKKNSIFYPPILLGYAAAILKDRNFEVVGYMNQMPSPDVDVVILHSSIVDYRNENNWIKRIKKEIKDVKVGVIGPFVSKKPELYMDNADFIIIGEPEKALMTLDFKSELSGKIISENLDDLDVLPFPDWNAFEYHKFKYKPYFISLRKKQVNFFPILSSRGCPMPCDYYCPYPAAMGKKWRSRSYINVVDEIEQLVNEFDADKLLFRDPYFSLDKKRAENIALEIIKRGIKVEFVCELHLNSLTTKLIDQLYDAGLRAVKVGIESVDPEVLKNSQRENASIKHQEEIIRYCEEKGISITAFYILGFPTDTKETVLKSLKYAKRLNTVGAQFVIMTPYPGTKFYDDIKHEIIDDDFQKFNIQNLVFKHNNFTKNSLLKLKNKCYNSYYLRFSWIMKMIKEKMV